MIAFLSNSDQYNIDESKSRGESEGVFLPKDSDEIKEILKRAREENFKITVCGNRTGVCGGSVPHGGYVLSTEKMDRILGIGYDNGFYVRVQPCVTVRQLSDALLTKHMGGIRDLTPEAFKQFKEDERKYFYPIDPTEMNGSLGGNAATNASGPRTLKYGPTRDWIYGLGIILTDGTEIYVPRGRYFAKGRHFDVDIDGRRLDFDIPSYEFNTDVKNAAGVFCKKDMDLIDMFIGSEGLFGIFSYVDVRLTEWHPLISNIMFFPEDDSALSFIKDMKKECSPEFLEYFDCGSIDLVRRSYSCDPNIPSPPKERCSAVFFDLDNENEYPRISEIAERYGGSLDNSWCSSDRRDREAMFRFRHSVPQAIFEYVASLKGHMPGIHKMGTDMSVPDDRSDEMMAYYKKVLDDNSLEYVIFGHMGNNHPHVEIILKDMDDFAKAKKCYDLFAEKSIELGGSPSAEHGIGKIKTGYIEMMYGPEGREEIIALKKKMDPFMILNIGNMVIP